MSHKVWAAHFLGVMDGENIRRGCACQKSLVSLFSREANYENAGLWLDKPAAFRPRVSNFLLPQVQTAVSASISDPHAGSRKPNPGQHDGKLYQHLPAGGNTRAVEGTVTAIVKMLRCCSQVTSVHSIPNKLCHPSPDRASLSPLSEPLSWSEWSCPSTTSQRST